MKLLLTSINAKFIHSNLAIHSINAFVKKYEKNIEILEFTINNSIDDILREIYNEQPDVVAISCYIWNIEIVKEIVVELKKILPNIDVWLGGPEVTYNSERQILEYPNIKGIIKGEGEKTFKELIKFYLKINSKLKNIKGLTYRDEIGNVINTGDREPLNLNEIPFPYTDKIKDFNNKIIYYESSRGCPFNCQYCLSSLEKQLRFRDFELVREEIIQFLEAKVKQVKFVDRTFNCNKEHAMKIWKFINDNDNGYTNFHFEISADLIDEETLEFLKTIRPGLFQFEIGVQSTHDDTLKVIKRKTDFYRLSEVVKRIQQNNNIHQHLDLIAGLPKEDYRTFITSFNDVYALKPEQLQLGFLKVLKGSGLYINSKEYGLVYKSKPPYEILSTNELPYNKILILKLVEEMVEIYYNSNQFTYTLKYLEQFFVSPFHMFEAIASYYEEQGFHIKQHSRLTRYDILLQFFREMIDQDDTTIKYALIIDLYLQEKLKKRPKWIEDNSNYKEKIRDFYKDDRNINRFLPEYSRYTQKQVSRMTHIEVLPSNILEMVQAKEIKKEASSRIFYIFNYLKKDSLTKHATISTVVVSK